jgi:hypothetical protein
LYGKPQDELEEIFFTDNVKFCPAQTRVSLGEILGFRRDINAVSEPEQPAESVTETEILPDLLKKVLLVVAALLQA